MYWSRDFAPSLFKPFLHLCTELLIVITLNQYNVSTNRSFSALTAGAIGSFVGTPAEISLIRMTAGQCSQFIWNHGTAFLSYSECMRSAQELICARFKACL